jgi:hypothetical protein
VKKSHVDGDIDHIRGSDMNDAQHPMTVGMLSGVAILSFLILLLTMDRALNILDEGIILTDAMRALNGEILHRDFYSNYGPGQYYIVALLFRLFGENFMTARVYDIAIRAAVVATLFYILRRQCPLLITLIFTALGGMWLLAIGQYLYPIFPCILLSLISSYLVTRAGVAEQTLPTIIGAGACAGLTALFRYETGFLLLMANLLSITILITRSNTEAKVSRVLLAFAAYAAGTCVVFMPAAIAFLLVSPIGPFLHDIVDYPTKYYPIMRQLPFPGLHAIRTAPAEGAVYIPLLAAMLTLFELAPLFAKRTLSTSSQPGNDRTMAYLIVFGSTSTLLFLKGVVRVSALHMMMGIVPSLIVFAILVKLWWRRGNAGRISAVLLLLLVFYPAGSATKRWLTSLKEDRSIAGWLALQAGLMKLPVEVRDACESAPASGIAQLGANYSRISNYLSTHSWPDERILIALDRHDKIFVNPVGLYFTAGRLPATRWHQFDPGLVNRAEIQTAIIEDLQRNRVRWVVRDASFDEVNEPNGSAKSSGITLLDRYLDATYRLVASSGKVAIWLANGETPAAIRLGGKCEASPVN